jgi:hypothetical protein
MESGNMKLLPPNPIHYQLHHNWKYVPSVSTDIKKTFRKIRENMKHQKLKSSKVREFKVK